MGTARTLGMQRSRIRRWIASVLIAGPAGFSTFETSAILGAVSLLSATAAPHLQQYLEMAHATKALGDVKVIALSAFRLKFDVGHIGRHQRVRPTLLVSEGDVPESSDATTLPWTAPLDGGATQSLAAHLVDNSAGYSVVPNDPFRWKGPYLEGLSADPWGSRYAMNVGFFQGNGGRTIFVVSPGPNRTVETPFEMVGLRKGGDDVVGIIGRGQ